MRFRKRILSMLLVLCMVLSMLPAIGLTASAANVTSGFTAAPAGTYNKVTDVSTLATGDTIIIVYESGSRAMSTTQNSNNRGYTAVTISDNSITLTDGNTVQGVVLQSSGDTSYPFLLYTGKGWLQASSYASGTSNNLRTVDTNAANNGAFWKFADGTIEAQGAGTRRFLRYNSNNSIFSCYATGSQQAIAIYKLAGGSSTTTYAVNLNQTTGGTISASPASAAAGETVTLSYTLDSGYSFGGWYVIDGEANEVTVTGNTFTMPASDVEVEATFNEIVLNTYTVTYHSAGSVYSTATVVEGNAIGADNLPKPTVDGWTFVGWSTTEIPTAQDSEPALYAGTETVTGNLDLYAVYAKAAAGTGTSYVKTDIGSIKPADEVVITATVNGTVYAMSNANGTGAAPAATAVTVSSNTLSATPDSTLLWNIVHLGGNLTIYPNGTTEKWLYCNNSNDGVRVGTNANNVFQIDSTSGYLMNTKTTAPRYLGVYNTADWRCYTNTTGNIANQTLAFYVKAATYTGYTTSPVVDISLSCTVNIRCGEGEASLRKNGEVIASVNTAGTPAQVYVSPGDEIVLVMKPASGYRLAAAEKGSDRILDSASASSDYKYKWYWNEDLGAYTYTYTIPATSSTSSDNYFNVSFLPRRMDTGITAVQASSLTEGLYVITGVSADQNTAPNVSTSNNQHDPANTYLLFGDDGLKGDVVGRKSAALKLSDINITLNNTSPYRMSGLNEACLYEIKAGTGSYAGYYTIRMCGASTNLYLACTGNKNAALEAVSSLSDNAYWSINIDKNGVAEIQNKNYTSRYLKFMAGGDFQFRTYQTATSGSTWPVLYKASQAGYTVSFDKNGSGTVKAYNTTSGSNVVSGSVQSAGSSIRFTFTPATNYELLSVEVNGESVALSSLTYDGITDSYSYTYSGLDRHITVTASFGKINSSIVVKYYVNNTEMTQKAVNLDGEYYYIDLTPSVTIEGSSKNYTYADLSFDKAANGAMEFTDVNEPIPVKSGDTVKLYFLTTAVSMSKTATETTKFNDAANGRPLGGTTDNSMAFTAANQPDAYQNVKQTFDISLDVNSTDMIKGYSEGGNTDIILVLDDSNSMHPDYSTNADLTKAAISEFLDVAFTAGSGNKVAVVRYNSLAGAWNGSTFVQYNGSMSGYSGITYNNCFMSTKTAVTTAVDAALTKDDSNGGTNMEGGFMMAEVVAKTRATSTDRNLLILIFTDGEPTFRYTDGSTTSYDYDGTTTSEYEYNEALAAGQSLHTAVNSYPNCSSFIYSVALLNESTYTEQDYTLVENLLGTSPKSFVSDAAEGYYYYTIRGKVDTAANWKSAAAYSNAYFAIKSSDTSVVKQKLADVFKQIAYTTVPDQYLTGTLVDTIPANFKLTAQSASALKSDGWTITENPDGTTTISKSGIVADNKASSAKDLTYEVVYQGGGYGAVYTNTSAQYTYTDILTGKEVVGTFTKPVVEVIPWTVNDHATAMLGTDLSIDIMANDLFAELTAGGYTVVDYKIRLTDASGNDTTYFDAVEQLGCKFDAVLNTSNQTVSFYTLTGGTHTFYYVVEATVKAPDKSLETVYSRVTEVDVTVPNVDLTKTATEVTKDSGYAADVKSDAHGNVQQLYLITLKIAKQNASDTIQNGVLTDVIPEGFTFVRFVAPTSGVTHDNGVITYSGITGDKTLKFLVRYTGNNSGVLYTNTTASFKYDFVSEDGTLSVTQYFKQPVAGIDPATVNDVDIVKSGDAQTIDVMANDLFTKDGMTLSDYIVSNKVVYITDENGVKLTQEQIDALDISLCVNDDGTVTYTTPKQIGDGSVYEFYYVVEARVTLPDGSTYAENNSTTLTSRPTKVTIYSVEDQYIVVDFGLPTVEKAYGVTKDAVIANGVSLTSLVNVSGLQGSVLYGTMSTSNGKYSFCPTTTNFSDTSYFSYTVKLDKGTYNAADRSVAGGVTVIPANNVYYEEDFIRWVNTTTNEWMNEGTAVDEKQAVTNILYGYDSTYEPESGKTAENYSNGSEKSVTVKNGAYEADAYFTFSGTGFDIYSECGKNSGVIVAEVYQCASQDDITKDTKPVKVILMDTYLNSDVSYFQIPVVMCRELNYNIYTVKIRAFYNAIFDHNYKAAVTQSEIREVLGLDDETELICSDMSNVSLAGAQHAETRAAAATFGQYNVYVDAVRIYNPLGTLSENSGIAYTAYREANELNPTFQNINDTVMDAESWKDADGQVEGILFVAVRNENAANGDTFSASSVCLGASGEVLKTEEQDAKGRYYLLDSNGKRIQYAYKTGKLADVYMMECTISDDLTASQEGRAFYYDADVDGNGKIDENESFKLTAGQLRKLDIVCYDSKYDAIGPENEIYLKKDQGLAFDVPNGAKVQISAKVPCGGSAEIWAYKNGWIKAATVNARTEMYYDLSSCVSGGKLILKCVTEDTDTVLSLCNAKGIGVSRGVSLLTVTSGTVCAAVDAFSEPNEHVHSYTDVVTEPTCTEKGYTTHTCKCGDNFVDSYVDALGHDWDKGEVTKEPTATEDGVRTYTCERCGETKTEVIKATAEKPCDGGMDCPGAQFSDVNVKAWYHESVDYVVTHDLMKGVTGGKFDPEGEMNRAMLVTVLWRYEGKPTGAKNTFSDVPAGEWYTDAVAWAAANGIVNGIGDGKFDPLGKITREQMATILFRYTEMRGVADTSKRGDLSGFPDEKQISEYATDAVAWAVGEGLILGSDGMLLPQGDATRAQVATILMRFIENIVK